jgi:hypothetical protein
MGPDEFISEDSVKVTSKRPEAIRTPVEITKDKYELWYLKPIMLGTIVREGKQWFTEDGMRFASSHDALDYLIRLRDSISSPADAEVEEKFKAMMKKNKSESRRVPTANGATATVASSRSNSREEVAVSAKDAELFRQFMAFKSEQTGKISATVGKRAAPRKK